MGMKSPVIFQSGDSIGNKRVRSGDWSDRTYRTSLIIRRANRGMSCCILTEDLVHECISASAFQIEVQGFIFTFMLLPASPREVKTSGAAAWTLCLVWLSGHIHSNWSNYLIVLVWGGWLAGWHGKEQTSKTLTRLQHVDNMKCPLLPG